MANLETTYMGLMLRNPIIAGSSGLMNDINYLKLFESAGAGAVVLKSVFEEQIHLETQHFLQSDDEDAIRWRKTHDEFLEEKPYFYEDAHSYINDFAKEHTLSRYLDFIREAKKQLSIPVISSIHCYSPYNWSYFAKRIEEAGADAIELNVYVLPSDSNRSGAENEQIYFDIIERILKQVSIPISLKIGNYFSSMIQTITQLSESGISGLVLFNRPFHPDIDIHTLKITSNFLYSNNEEYINTLRWIAILSDRVKCDLAAAGGIHNYEALVKQILAGASAVQVVSALYQQGPLVIETMLKNMQEWMNSKGFNSISDFKGKLSQSNIENPAAFERVQFMKLYSKVE